MKKVLFLLVTILLSSFIYGQSDQINAARKMLNDRGEIYFSLTLSENDRSKESLAFLDRIISIDKVEGNIVTAYANKKQFDKFLELEINFKMLTPPSMLYSSILENASSIRNIDSWDYYPGYSEYISIMNQFATDYPDLCEVVNIGNSNNEREILFIHINNNLGEPQNEPEFMYTSSIHGDELVGYVLMLRLIDYLLDNYDSDPEITNIVDNIDIWINPLANPDGTFAGGNNSVWGATRGNANGIDMNRNYADPEDGSHPDGNAYQTETLHFMDFAEDHDIVMSCNIHGGSEVLNYPWDTWSILAADDDWWYYISREYADTAQYYSPSGYLTDLNNGVTNGYAWYSISGGRQDYMNYFHNCREVTLEISTVKTPWESQLNDFWEWNYRSLLKYMEHSLYGFSGIVTNSVSGNPIIAKVFIENHDIDNSEVYSQLPVGNYHRPIKAGTYDVTFSAFGCYDKTLTIETNDAANLQLDVELIPYGTLSADFTAATTLTGAGNSIDFMDNSIGSDIDSWLWTFEGGNPSTSTDQNPVGIVYENVGEFDVALTVENTNGFSDTKTLEKYITIKQAYNMSNESVSTCDALFYDSGNENDNYSDNEEFTMTFTPDIPYSLIKIDFIEFEVEGLGKGENDYLEIYDGIDLSAPLIGSWSGTDSPGTIIAGTETGALTLYFYSNNTVTKPGWKALVSCDSNVGVHFVNESTINIFPNPVSSKINISAGGKIMNIKLTDMHGRVLYKLPSAEDNHSITVEGFEHGIYLLSFEYDRNIITEKVMIH